ncbi:MAG TPA: HigA family addiction module antitoxin [Longimicrobiaceae bacterium]|jgi:addiction module HigA family antidote|nr:HigA family addiction module antitoxin [Longimicrobiaceae bacterium]
MDTLSTDRPPRHPGEVLLEEFINPLGLSLAEAARRLRISYPRLHEIIRGKRAVTTDTALRMERLFGIDANFWLDLQRDWDVWRVVHSPAAKDMERIEAMETHGRIAALDGAVPSLPLSRARATSIIQAAEPEIRALGVLRLALFGSVVRDEARPDSDVDVLVQFDEEQKTFANFMALAELLEARLGRRVELVTTEALSPYIGPHILAEAADVLHAA